MEKSFVGEPLVGSRKTRGDEPLPYNLAKYKNLPVLLGVTPDRSVKIPF
jgi:hypothetical protein